MRVLCLDCDLGISPNYQKFSSTVSLFEYDVVFWNPLQSLREYTLYSEIYQGRDSLTENESARLMNDVSRRRGDFKEFIEMGRCLVVFLPGDVQVYVDTGQREYSGTGRNRVPTRIVKNFSILSAIPLDLKVSPGSGLEITPANEIMAAVFRQTRDNWIYRSVIEPHKTIKPLLYIKGTKKAVAGMVRVKGAGGTLVLLPDLVLPFAEDEDEAEEDSEVDTPVTDQSMSGEAEVGGEIATDQTDELEHWPGDLLLNWIESLMAEPDASLPSWTLEYKFPSEANRTVEQVALAADLSKLQARIDALNAEQAQDEQWKALIAGTGVSLERRVREAFEVFGFEFEDVEAGRSDLRGSYDGRQIVVEVKGVSKSAAEKNAAQLEKWVSEELAEGRQAKAVLVVNTWREMPLRNRSETDFPNQMLRYSEQRGHCLLTGLQLLSMVRACLDSPERASEIASLILETVGPLDNWDDLDSLFVAHDSQVESTESATDQPDSVEGERVEPPEGP